MSDFVSDRCRACDLYRNPCPGAERKCDKWTPMREPGGKILAGDEKSQAASALKAEEDKASRDAVKTKAATRKKARAKKEPLEIRPMTTQELVGVTPVAGDVLAPPDDGVESKHAKFQRIMGTRLPRVLDEIRKLKNLATYYERKKGDKARVYTYSWDRSEADSVLRDLKQAVGELEMALNPDTDNREGGLL